MSADEPPRPAPPPSVRRGRVVRLAVVALLGLAGLLAVGIVPRMQRRAELASGVRAATTAVPMVAIISPTPGAKTSDLLLPGNVQAIQETALFSRVDGYLKRRLVDIGDRVEVGQVLAEIDTPELDSQLAQARATLAQAQAAAAQSRSALQQARATLQHSRSTAEYNRTNLGRWRLLRDKNLVAQQDVDDRQIAVDGSQAEVEAAQANVEALDASVGAAQANVEANRANVQRLVDLQSFQRVRAPFDGVITVRNVDPGALITSGSNTNTMPMFRIAQTDTLRVLVNVPQTFTTSIEQGQKVQVIIREFPKRPFAGRVAASSGALDPASRTLLTEVRMDNAGNVLRPGMYAEVRFHVERDTPPLLIPTSALIIRASGPRVAVVDADMHVRYQPVELGRDYGATVEIVRGLAPGDRLVADPPDGLQEGSPVKPAPTPTTKPRA